MFGALRVHKNKYFEFWSLTWMLQQKFPWETVRIVGSDKWNEQTGCRNVSEFISKYDKSMQIFKVKTKIS